jgi:hypothetical protein
MALCLNINVRYHEHINRLLIVEVLKKNAMNTSLYESIVVLISKESVMSWINILYLMC